MWKVRAKCQVGNRPEAVPIEVNPDQLAGDALFDILEAIGLYTSRLHPSLKLVMRPDENVSGADVWLDKEKVLRDQIQENSLLEVTGDTGVFHEIEDLPDPDLRICSNQRRGILHFQ